MGFEKEKILDDVRMHGKPCVATANGRRLTCSDVC